MSHPIPGHDYDEPTLEGPEPEEEVSLCEKCGDETGTKTVGDESYNYCKECNWVTHN